jgi:hypothetical protein
MVVDCGNGARHAVVALDRHWVGIAPNLASVRQREAPESVLPILTVIIHEINPAVENRGAGITFADVQAPKFSGLPWLPGAKKFARIRAGFVADPGAIGAAEPWPGARRGLRLAVPREELARIHRVGPACFGVPRTVRARDTQLECIARAVEKPGQKEEKGDPGQGKRDQEGSLRGVA